MRSGKALAGASCLNDFSGTFAPHSIRRRRGFATEAQPGLMPEAERGGDCVVQQEEATHVGTKHQVPAPVCANGCEHLLHIHLQRLTRLLTRQLRVKIPVSGFA